MTPAGCARTIRLARSKATASARPVALISTTMRRRATTHLSHCSIPLAPTFAGGGAAKDSPPKRRVLLPASCAGLPRHHHLSRAPVLIDVFDARDRVNPARARQVQRGRLEVAETPH